MTGEKKRIYISGAITGVKDFREHFKSAEKFLQYVLPEAEVINPARLNKVLPTATEWAQYMDISLCALKGCTHIYMLEGWENSKGAQIERLYAAGSGMKVMYECTEHQKIAGRRDGKKTV